MMKMKRFMGILSGAVMGIMAIAGGMPMDMQIKSGFAVEAQASSKTRDEAVRWTYNQEGKGLDYDGAYGNQCVDLIKYYYDFFGVASYARGNGYQYATNKLPQGWTRIKNTPSFIPEPGDIAVWTQGIGKNGHVAIILSADLHNFVSMDQNWGASYCKQVRHNYKNFWGVVRPSYASKQNTVKTPGINNVTIDSICADKLAFHFKAADAAMAKVTIRSRDTGEQRTETFTSGLDNISYVFETRTMPHTVALDVTIQAYSDRNGSNPVEHKMTYGSQIGVVDLVADGPKGIEQYLFDARFYADTHPDLKAAYGYNERELYIHWRKWGIYEGRWSSIIYHPDWILAKNTDVRKSFGKDYAQVYEWFINYGYKEYRESSEYYCGQGYQNRYAGEFSGMDSQTLLWHYKSFGCKEGRQAGEQTYRGTSSWK